MKEELLKGLTQDQIEKVKACDDVHDLLQLAIDEGVELNEEQLAAVNGGCAEGDPKECPKCHSYNTEFAANGQGTFEYKCNDCGYSWKKTNLAFK